MIRFVVRALATWRLTALVVEDEVTRPAREWVARRWPGSKAAYLATCPRCVSVWTAAVALLAPAWLCEVLALSSITIALNDWRDSRASAALTARMVAASGGVQRASEATES